MLTIPVALVQFDSVPEKKEKNINRVTILSKRAVSLGARWIMFHENTLCDYTSNVAELAEPIPSGRSTQRIVELSKKLNCYISVGLLEKSNGKYYISQVFTGPKGYIYHYRKTWLWREAENHGFRNEWAEYDPGTGPELFDINDIKATCFICADGEAPRCIERAAELKPQVVFYPNNRAVLPDFDIFGKRAKTINAPMLVTNRVGISWIYNCSGGCVVYSASGEVLAKANRNGKEEILIHNLNL